MSKHYKQFKKFVIISLNEILKAVAAILRGGKIQADFSSQNSFSHTAGNLCNNELTEVREAADLEKEKQVSLFLGAIFDA